MNSSVWAIWAALAVREKNGFEFFWATFEGGFFKFLRSKKNFKTNFLKNYKGFLVHTLQSLGVFLPTKSWKNHPQKLLRKTQIHFFPYCPELPKRPKQNNLCSKMWSIDQLYIELGAVQKLYLKNQMILWIRLQFDERNLHIPKDAAHFQTPKIFNQILWKKINMKEERMKRLIHPRSLKVETTCE